MKEVLDKFATFVEALRSFEDEMIDYLGWNVTINAHILFATLSVPPGVYSIEETKKMRDIEPIAFTAEIKIDKPIKAS